MRADSPDRAAQGDWHGSELSEQQIRVRALESILTEKGYVKTEALDRIIETYETRIGPHIGAAVIARAWASAGFHSALMKEPSRAVASLGYIQHGGSLIAVENTPRLHNLVVCTLCSCYPTALLGLPPVWYKSFAYRSRAVAEPRSVLRDFGIELPAETQIRVWDSTAELRYLVVPMRPPGTEGWNEAELAAIVTRDSMVGTGLPGLGRPERER
jgi:nitrile hydratase